MACKRYVEMIVRYMEDGTILPLAIRWTSGQIYEVDRVLDIRPAASLKAGGAGIRYTCRILGHERYVWLEGSRWFVEGKE